MSAKLPVVSWAGPLLRAEQTLHQAGEVLSLRKREEGLKLLTEHLQHVRDAINFIQNNPL